MEVDKILSISAHGMKAQGVRVRIVAQNLANAHTTAPNPNEDPYRRQVVTFRNVLNREMDVDHVQVHSIGVDNSDFGLRHDPDHPSADEAGYVRTPNVNSLIELMDMREAQRSYEANVNVIDLAKQMAIRTIDMLRS